MKTNILQTKDWQKFLNDEGNKTFWIEEERYTAMCVLKTTPVGNYLFLPYGPCPESQKDFKNSLTAIKKIAKENNAVFARIEPTFTIAEKTIKSEKLKKVKDVDPKSTVWLDLTKSEDEILANFDKKKRQYYRNYKNKGITIRQSKDQKDMEILFKYYQNLMDKRSFTIHEKSYMANQLKYDFAKLYIIEFENTAIGASLIYDEGDTRYYAYAAYSEEHKNHHTNDVLLAQMIFDAKADGKKTFDFWGATTSEDPKDPWYGFTKYKLSFGGDLKSYSGTYDIVINPTKYHLYTTLRKINRVKRKIMRK